MSCPSTLASLVRFIPRDPDISLHPGEPYKITGTTKFILDRIEKSRSSFGALERFDGGQPITTHFIHYCLVPSRTYTLWLQFQPGTLNYLVLICI
ncbi:hypothetical protein AVEN_9598-1 [Araneus ventricosus]|uniref:Uncharacterized protein n=1 Tax=Araneus ventricosus TaxID=182803 RepID=A0A4Y2H823_ARAVE|nr:hypothetical protein AVEN_9598-1 [Araneus ventricosus]